MEARTGKISLSFALYRDGQLLGRQTVAQDIVKVGKDPRSHVLVNDDAASRMHAVIEVTGTDDITLIDLGNEPGTRVNGQRVNKCKLHAGDQIEIGATVLHLESAGVMREAPPVPRRVTADVAAAAPFFAAPVAPVTAGNPFAASAPGLFGFAPLTAASNPFVASATSQTSLRDSGTDEAAIGPHSYALVKNGPDVNPDEVEVAHLASIEVMVLWDTNVLHVDHLTPPRSYFVGEESGSKEACDYFLPCEALGTTRAPIVLARGGSATLILLPRTTGTVDLPGTGTVTFADLIATGRARTSSELPGAHALDLPAGARAKMTLPDSGLTFQINTVNAGKPVATGLFAQFDPAAHAFFGLSLLLHLSIVASIAFFMPSLGGDDAEAMSRDQILMMQHLLSASAEHEPELRELEQTADNTPHDNKEGGTGTRATGEEGAMGNNLSKETGHKYGVAGPKENTDPHLAREKAIADAREFGMVGILNSGGGGDPNAPTSPWGRDDSQGNDPKSALGNMWGDSIGESFGNGGLGLSGTGEGGGGKGEGIGLGEHGVLGHGRGLGDGDGFGNGHGGVGGTYHPHPMSLRQGVTNVNGQLPAEVIQRIVRENFGRFRMCYSDGLRTNPTLEGRVSVKFVIDRHGAVAMSSDGGSDLPDHQVVQCVVRGFQNLSFPEPAGGIVTVVYPIVLSPGT